MNEIESNFPKTVIFKPEKNDFIYLSRALTSAVTYSRRAQYIHNVFLLINAIFVPALLLFLDYWILSLVIFIAHIFVVIFFVPVNQKKADLDYLNHFYDDIPGDETHELELSEMGINYRALGHGTFVAYEHIVEIQESPDAIYFFTKYGGLPVRKSAFPTDIEVKGFVGYARSNVRLARSLAAPSKPIASITD